MSRAFTLICALAMAWACGGGGGHQVDGNLGDGNPGNGDASGGGSWSIVKGAPATLFSIDGSNVQRYSDTSDDGDSNELSERNVFFQGIDGTELFALDQHSVLLLDDENQIDVIYLLRDMNSDGDAMDAGESSTWWGGIVPGGSHVGRFEDIARGTDGTIHVLTDSGSSEPIYALNDLNQDGDVDDAGEVTLEASIGSGDATAGGIAADSNGDLWYSARDAKSLYRVHNGSASVAMSTTVLTALQVANHGGRPERLHDGSIVFAGYSTDPNDNNDDLLVAMRDANADGIIDASEANKVWTTKRSDFPCQLFDLRELEDGSLLSTGLDSRICRMVDGNQNANFFDPGEVHVTYDIGFAKQYGQPDQGVVYISTIAGSTN